VSDTGSMLMGVGAVWGLIAVWCAAMVEISSAGTGRRPKESWIVCLLWPLSILLFLGAFLELCARGVVTVSLKTFDAIQDHRRLKQIDRDNKPRTF
jgi:hypothetical protein